MTNINRIEKIDNLNIGVAEVLKAKEQFKKIFESRVGRWAPLLRTKSSSLFDAGIKPHLIPQISILDGLAALVLGIEKNIAFRGLYHFEFFIYFFTMVWSESNDRERVALEGELYAGIKDERQLSSLYFELLVGFIYKFYGSAVHFKDIFHARDSGYDMGVTKGPLDVCAEVKTIEYHSGFPFNADWMAQGVTKLMKHLEGNPERWPGYHVDIVFVGKRAPSHVELLSNFDQVIEQIGRGKNTVQSSLLRAQIRFKSGMEIENALNARLSAKKVEGEPDYLLVLASPSPTRPGSVGVRSLEPWNLPKKIRDVISDAAKRQLPTDRQQVIWIQLVGSTAANRDDHRILRQLVTGDSTILTEVNKRRKHSDAKGGLIGLHLTGDAFTFFREADNTFGVALRWLYMGGGGESLITNYLFSMIGMLPSAMPAQRLPIPRG